LQSAKSRIQFFAPEQRFVTVRKNALGHPAKPKRYYQTGSENTTQFTLVDRSKTKKKAVVLRKEMTRNYNINMHFGPRKKASKFWADHL
jgi:hypothetical protein